MKKCLRDLSKQRANWPLDLSQGSTYLPALAGEKREGRAGGTQHEGMSSSPLGEETGHQTYRLRGSHQKPQLQGVFYVSRTSILSLEVTVFLCAPHT